MAARATMAALITRLRKLIGDTEVTPVLDDEELQSFLDRHRTEWRYEPLCALETIAPGGAITYLDHRASRGNWEEGEKLFDSSYTELAIAADGADRVNGRWTLAASCYVALVKGFTYDLYAAAVDALEEWAAKEKLNFDFTTDGQTFRESQKVDALLALADKYRRQAMASSAPIRQTEFTSDHWRMAYR